MTVLTETRVHEYDGREIINDKVYYRDSRGALVPESTVKPEHLLEDQTVRKIMTYAEDLSAQIARFRGHTFDDIATLVDLLAEKYGAVRRGRKGNMTFTSYDGTLKVQVQVAEQITFGPELQIAKELVDQCIARWSDGVRDEIRVLVDHAFQVDKEGKINRQALFALRRLQIADETWKAAMEAITDAVRVIGAKTYVRFYRRKDVHSPWTAITIDIANA